MPDDGPRFITAKDVADELGVHRNTVYKLIKRGEIPGARKIGGEWRIPRWSLDEMGEPAHLATA
jgi:excisionase family DNA binding protein